MCAKKAKKNKRSKAGARGPSIYILAAFIVLLFGGYLIITHGGEGLVKPTCREGAVAEKGYAFTVLAEGLPSIDNLAMTEDGGLYATLEERGGQGKVVRILPDGKHEVILRGLNRPDGLRAAGGKLYIVEEVKKGRVIEYDLKKKSWRVIARIGHAEGLAVLPGGGLLVTRDRKKGRLFRLEPDGKKTVLQNKLKRPEGIVLGKKGEVFIAETATGRVLEFKDGTTKTILSNINNPDQLAITPDGALLITEDANPGRLLSYKNGRLSTIARCLSSPQGILPEGDSILVSEQGRGQVLKFTRR